jgi:hypothetical protein
VVTEGLIMDRSEQPRSVDNWYRSVKAGANHRLIENTTRDAAANYRSSKLADRKQDRMDSWQNGFTPKQRNAQKAVAGVPEEGRP